jgi:hypothetical protein
MPAGLLVLAAGVVALGEVAVDAGLLVGVARSGRQMESRLELGAGGGGLASLVQGHGQDAQRRYYCTLSDIAALSGALHGRYFGATAS